MVFITELIHSKGYVMYKEHSNGGMIEIEPCNVSFLKDEFPSIGEIIEYLELYELQEDLQPTFGEGKDLNFCQVIEDGELV